jgi:aquaporin Z
MRTKALAAEFIGTFTLITAIFGTALFSAPAAGLVAVAFAAGLAVLTMAYAVGHISGGHFNPAVTLGLVAAGRFSLAEAPGYIAAQLLGAGAAAAVMAAVLSGAPAGVDANSFAQISNGYGERPFYAMGSAFLIELTVTALFLMVIVGATAPRAPQNFAPLAIGLALTAFHLAAIPVSNASLNPARSTASALFGGAGPLADLWLFWAAPILGGVIGGIAMRWLQDEGGLTLQQAAAKAMPKRATRR